MVKSRLVMAIGAALMAASCASTTPANENTNKTNATAPQVQTLSADPLASAQGTAEFTIEQIMADPDWMGRFPENAFWSMDGEHILFYQKREGSDIRDLMIIENAEGEASKVALSDYHLYVADEKEQSVAGNWLAYTYEGNVFARFGDGSVKQLTRDEARQHNLQAMTDGSLSYQQGNDFYVVDVNSGLTRQIASIKFEDAPKANEEPKDYLAKEEQQLIQYVQKSAKQRKSVLNVNSSCSLKTQA